MLELLINIKCLKIQIMMQFKDTATDKCVWVWVGEGEGGGVNAFKLRASVVRNAICQVTFLTFICSGSR